MILLFYLLNSKIITHLKLFVKKILKRLNFGKVSQQKARKKRLLKISKKNLKNFLKTYEKRLPLFLECGIVYKLSTEV